MYFKWVFKCVQKLFISGSTSTHSLFGVLEYLGISVHQSFVMFVWQGLTR
jgi:hypothetical protein